MAKRGPIKILTEKMHRQYGKDLNYYWTDQYKWTYGQEFARNLRSKVEQVKEETSKKKVVCGLLKIAERGLTTEVQGLEYDQWDNIFKLLEFGPEEVNWLVSHSDRTGERDENDQFILDWTALREGQGVMLLGTQSAKVRWDVVCRLAESLL